MHDSLLEEDVKTKLHRLNLAKSAIFLSLFFSSIATRLSFYLFIVVVGILGWPVLLIHYFVTREYQKKLEADKVKAKQAEEERRQKVLMESPALSGRGSIRMN